MFTPRSILITGGAGFIGSACVRHAARILDESSPLVVVDSLEYASDRKRIASLEKRIAFYPCDICDTEKMARLIDLYRIDTIINTAAQTHVDRSIEAAAPFIHSNVEGTVSLLEAARSSWDSFDSKRFYQMSTDEVFGQLVQIDGAFSEQSPIRPRSPYAASKASADLLALSFYHTHGLPVIIGNASNTYGPCQHEEKFLPLVISRFLAGKEVPVYGSGLQFRDWLYLSDHVEAVFSLISRGEVGMRYCIGTKEVRTNLQMLALIARELSRLTGIDQEAYLELVQHVTDRKGHDWGYRIDATKLKECTGWKAGVFVEEGLRKLLHWYITEHKTLI